MSLRMNRFGTVTSHIGLSLSMALVVWGQPTPSSAGGALSETQEVIARSEILQLFAWTTIAFDNRDFDRFATAFSQDGGFRVRFDDASRNVNVRKDELKKTLAGRGSQPTGDRHMTANLSVTFKDATHAKLQGYNMWMKPLDNGGMESAGHGSYDIELVKSGSHWLFLNYVVVHTSGGAPLD